MKLPPMAIMTKMDKREGGSKTSLGGCYEEDEQEKKKEAKLRSTVVATLALARDQSKGGVARLRAYK